MTQAIKTNSTLCTEFQEEGVLFASWGHYLINLWTTAQPTAKHLKKLGDATKMLRSKNEQGVSLLVILEKASLPTAEQRALLSKYYSSHADSFLCVGQVIEGRGLWAHTVRGILTTVNLLQSAPYPAGVFKSVEGASRWAERHNKVSPVDPAELTQKIQETRALGV